jgi:hypothetical protein
VSTEGPGGEIENARALRQALDELDELRHELADARADLVAMAARLEAREGDQDAGSGQRRVANVAFLAKQQRREGRRQRVLTFIAPVRDTWLFRPLERTARRMRASRRS